MERMAGASLLKAFRKPLLCWSIWCAAPHPVRVPPLQDYIADRVAGRSGPAWLDDPPLEQVIRITERLGAFPEFGPHTLFEDLTVREQDTASACGWRYVSKGADGIFHAFRILQAGSDPMQSVGRKGLRDKWDGFEL